MDSSININLNDVSVQEFDTSGSPIRPSNASRPELDGDMADAYAAMVDAFEKRIENSPEARDERMQTTADREFADLIEAIDRGIENANTPKGTTEFGKVAPAGSGGQPPDANDPSFWDDPLPTQQPTDPNTGGPPQPPSGSGSNNNPPPNPGQPNNPGNPPPNQPPDPPDFDLGGTGIGALMGPEFGIGLMVFADTIDLVVAGLDAFVDVVEAVDDAMQSLVDDTKAFSADVAQASAMRDVTDILIRMNRAEEMGPDIARWIESRTEIDVVTGRLATDVSQVLIPLVQRGTDALLDVLTVVQGLEKPAEDFGSGILAAMTDGAIGPELKAVVSYLDALAKTSHMALKLYRKEISDKTIGKDNLINGGFARFLMEQAAPVMGIGEDGNIAIQGGFGAE